MEIAWELSVGWAEGGKGTENKKHKWQVENRQGEVKNNTGNGEAKELICTTHGHGLKWGECWMEGGCWAKGDKGEKIMGQL